MCVSVCAACAARARTCMCVCVLFYEAHPVKLKEQKETVLTEEEI